MWGLFWCLSYPEPLPCWSYQLDFLPCMWLLYDCLWALCAGSYMGSCALQFCCELLWWCNPPIKPPWSNPKSWEAVNPKSISMAWGGRGSVPSILGTQDKWRTNLVPLKHNVEVSYPCIFGISGALIKILKFVFSWF